MFIIILIKSIEKKYTENFLNGHIHFTNYKKFREIEKEKIGDPKEVKITNNLNGKHTVKIEPHNSDISIEFIADGIIEAKEPIFKSTIKIDCYSIVDEEYIEKEFKDNNLININVNTNFFEELERLEPDRDILICYNAEEFIDRINKNLKKKFLSRKVKYFPVNENPYAKHIRNIENLSYEKQHNIAIDSIFQKEETFKNQKEYRLAVIDLDDDFISIGDIRDLFINITNEV
ncbi:hypothetical protein D0420_12530 [Staphylococcus saprophyticus]|uniref:hypothetical protein n=2 Tax=Staphylococcus saprophyticus TaxID=29385 RepID=UPI001932FEA6|nr:hypothetical protein [Staphylococcus saprophyticus]MBM0846119.1 hypothetical protein [Staphylococcus saprophyticus]